MEKHGKTMKNHGKTLGKPWGNDDFTGKTIAWLVVSTYPSEQKTEKKRVCQGKKQWKRNNWKIHGIKADSWMIFFCGETGGKTWEKTTGLPWKFMGLIGMMLTRERAGIGPEHVNTIGMAYSCIYPRQLTIDQL